MSAPPNGRLDGWKAIADHLARDQRTVQRWHKERGMPVHRVPGGKRGAVFAHRAELDAWLSATEPAGNNQPVLSNLRVVAVDPGGLERPAENRLEVSPTLPRGIDGSGNHGLSQPVPAALVADPSSRRRRLAPVLMAAFFGLAIVGAALVAGTLPVASANVERVELKAGGLAGVDSDGRQLWSFALPYPAGLVRSDVELQGTASLDFDGDGTREWLAFVEYSRGPKKQVERDEVYYLSSTGRLLWSFTPDQTFSFAGRQFSGPWRAPTYFPSPEPSLGIWVSFIHHTWWPSFLVRLGARGDASVAFVNAGHIESVRRINLAERSYILAGGVNNEYRTAALAVLDEANLPASSPQSPGSSFACDNCPAGKPRRYLLFPRSELSVAFDQPYNFADEIFAPGDDGALEVSVRETPAPENLRVVYRLSADFMPVSIAMSDWYWEKHRELSLAGKLDHAPESCPERIRGVAVKIWEPATGWKELAVPPAFPVAAATR